MKSTPVGCVGENLFLSPKIAVFLPHTHLRENHAFHGSVLIACEFTFTVMWLRIGTYEMERYRTGCSCRSQSRFVVCTCKNCIVAQPQGNPLVLIKTTCCTALHLPQVQASAVRRAQPSTNATCTESLCPTAAPSVATSVLKRRDVCADGLFALRLDWIPCSSRQQSPVVF